MFRKPKRKGPKEVLRRRKPENDEEEEGAADKTSGEAGEEEDTTALISEARKRLKSGSAASAATSSAATTRATSALHSFESQKEASISNADLATRVAMHLPDKNQEQQPETGRGADGIYRNNQLNKFHAGPIKASGNIRVTSRFDYQPDVCKDYKDTGFCGYGDTCIYLHDRGDTMSGWQIEQQWQQEQDAKKEAQEKALAEFMDSARGGSSTSNNKEQLGDGTTTIITDNDDGLPFACHVCRQPFTDPVVTICQHYFCQNCILKLDKCPICNKETHSVFHEPTKLISKKKKVLGLSKSKEPDSWQLFAEEMSSSEKK